MTDTKKIPHITIIDTEGIPSSDLQEGNFGLERESVRTETVHAFLSQTPHPKFLGSSLMHPWIKTDFSEAQIEYATDPRNSIEETLADLRLLHQFTAKGLESEVLWSFSMPPRLPSDDKKIPLALYGKSRDGQTKTIYRRGLGYRYGRKMQTISGVHFNFSFSENLLQFLSHKRYKKNISLATRSELYLHTIRNFNRYSGLLFYLFGASPAIDSSFTDNNPHLKPWKKKIHSRVNLPLH